MQTTHPKERCKPFQTFQILEMDASANVLNFPNTIHCRKNNSKMKFRSMQNGNNLAVGRSRLQHSVRQLVRAAE